MQIMSKVLVFVFMILSSLTLLGCAPLEHRSEVIAKSPLPTEDKSCPKPTLVWSKKLTNGVSKKDVDLNLVVHQNTLWVADTEGKICAVNRETGQVAWQENLNTGIISGPSLKDSLLVVGLDKGEVRALRSEDGTFLWQSPITGERLGAPTIGNKAVFVNSMDGSVTALSKQDGRQLWRHQFQMPTLVLRKVSTPVWGNDRKLYVGLSNGSLVSLQEDGNGIWDKEVAVPRGHTDIERMVDISAEPVVGDDGLYVASFQGRLSRLERSSGNIVWEKPFSSANGIALNKQAVFATENDGVISSFSKKSGQLLWKQDILRGYGLTKPVIHGQFIVVGDKEGYLHWLNAEDGSYAARARVDSKGISGPPVAYEGLLYSQSKSGKVAVYQVPSQSLQSSNALQ